MQVHCRPPDATPRTHLQLQLVPHCQPGVDNPVHVQCSHRAARVWLKPHVHVHVGVQRACVQREAGVRGAEEGGGRWRGAHWWCLNGTGTPGVLHRRISRSGVQHANVVCHTRTQYEMHSRGGGGGGFVVGSLNENDDACRSLSWLATWGVNLNLDRIVTRPRLTVPRGGGGDSSPSSSA